MYDEFLITPDGDQVCKETGLSTWRSSGRADNGILDFMVRNCGYIHCTFAKSAIRVVMNKRAVSAIAATRLLYELIEEVDRRWRPVSICVGSNVTETFHCRTDLVDRVASLVDSIPLCRHGRFSRRRLRLDSLELPGALAGLVEICRGSHDPASSIVVRRYLDEVLMRRYMSLTCNRASGRLVLENMESGYYNFDARWRSRAVGRPVGHFHDRSYSNFVLASYREAAASEEPVLEQLDVQVRPRERKGFDASYFRLLVPFRRKETDETLLLGASLIYRHKWV